jgi:death on curing protein
VTEPLWLELSDVHGIHTVQLARFSGGDGVRDEDLIASALARPINMYHYENVIDLLALAVRLGLGIAKAHGYVDGNKRTGLASLIEFLAINGLPLLSPLVSLIGRSPPCETA